MKTAFGIICVTLAAHYVAAQCPNFKTYTTELKPACSEKDINVKWPNYANLSTYFTCFGMGNPVLTPCPKDEYFTYVFQQCTNCNQYIPAPPCENLKTQNPPNCVPLGTGCSDGGNGSQTTAQTYPTPYYPTTTTTKKPTVAPVTKAPVTKAPVTKAPVTKKTTVAPPIVPPTAAPTAAPTPSGSANTIAGPPVPTTNAPGVPTPPTPEPTPPVLNLTPPSA